MLPYRCLAFMALLFIVCCVSGCVDVFTPRKDIVGGYYVEKYEDNTFQIQEHGHEINSVGVVEGTVERLGWSRSVILAWRRASYRGDPDGWMVIDTSSHSVKGPISDDLRLHSFPEIKVYPIAEAWKKL